MVTHALASHLVRIFLTVGPGFVAWAGLGKRVGAADPEPRTPQDLSRAVTTASVLLVVFGWLAFPWLLREPKAPAGPGPGELPAGRSLTPSAPGEDASGELRVPACLLMVGLAAACVSAKLGIRLEVERLRRTGAGTDMASMMKRATFFFFAVSAGTALWAGANAGIGRGLGWRVALGLSGLWLPAAVAWRVRPKGGAVGPAASVAWRATFFALAIFGLVSAAVPTLLGEGASRPLGLSLAALWMGVGLGALTVIEVAWLATRIGARGSILGAGLLATLAGLCLCPAV